MLMLQHWNLDLKKKIGEESTSSHE